MIDNSREMLAIARTNLEQADLKNCQVRIGDMYRLPFAENRFGLIRSLFSFSTAQTVKNS